MSNRKTLIDVIENPSSGIITALNAFDVPWKTNQYYVPDDMDYTLNHAADRYVTRMVTILLNSDGVLSSNALGILANVIYKMFGEKWRKMYATIDYEYNPIENYNMVERMTNDKTEHIYDSSNTRTDDLTHTKSGDETLTHDTTNERTADLNTTRETDVQGFNSSAFNPADKEAVDETGTDTVTTTGTDTTEHDLTMTDSGTVTDEKSGKDTDVRNYLLTRSGNIGVTTSQDMIQSERELWEFDFVRMVYHDIDRIMVTDYYKGGC